MHQQGRADAHTVNPECPHVGSILASVSPLLLDPPGHRSPQSPVTVPKSSRCVWGGGEGVWSPLRSRVCCDVTFPRLSLGPGRTGSCLRHPEALRTAGQRAGGRSQQPLVFSGRLTASGWEQGLPSSSAFWVQVRRMSQRRSTEPGSARHPSPGWGLPALQLTEVLAPLVGFQTFRPLPFLPQVPVA